MNINDTQRKATDCAAEPSLTDPWDFEKMLETEATPILSKILAGLSPPEVTRIVEDLLHLLASFAQEVPRDLCLQYVATLRTQLKRHKYHCDTVKYYTSEIQRRAGKAAQNESSQRGLASGFHVVETGDEATGIYMGDKRLTNFVIRLTSDMTCKDGDAQSREFAGTITVAGRTAPIVLTPRSLSSERDFQESIYMAGGPTVLFEADFKTIRRAVSELSIAAPKTVSNDFGWDADGLRYRFPNGSVSEAGFVPATLDDPMTVDLQNIERARSLDLHTLAPEQLDKLRRHLVEDMLKMHIPAVMIPALASVVIAATWKFVPPGFGRFAVWLIGPTGSGKTFLLRLLQNFFGRFPTAEGLVSWASTPNYIEKLGFYYKDALLAVDDYKPEIASRAATIRVLQNYADRSSRGRLQADSNTQSSRPIRGFLVCTGEDYVAASASAFARTIDVPVPRRDHESERGLRCVQAAEDYPAITTDFIRWFLANGRAPAFAQACTERATTFAAMLGGAGNAGRIAANYGVMAAGMELLADYLADVWPEGPSVIKEFINQEWTAQMQAAAATVHSEQEGVLLLAILGDLIRQREVRIDDLIASPSWKSPQLDAKLPVVGRVMGNDVALNTTLCLEVVNSSLRRQARPEIRCTPRTLLGQLRDAKIVAEESNKSTRLRGQVVQGFRVRILDLLPEYDTAEC